MEKRDARRREIFVNCRTAADCARFRPPGGYTIVSKKEAFLMKAIVLGRAERLILLTDVRVKDGDVILFRFNV